MTLHYQERYASSRALVVGIDSYAQGISPLRCAVNDARAVERVLRERYGFPRENVRLLLNEEATQRAIREAFEDVLIACAGRDDRLVFYFAGHGVPRENAAYDESFGGIVPVDAHADAEGHLVLRRLIPWQELKLYAIRPVAKHVLLILDACYSGLATQASRGVLERRVRNMLTRRAVQVLTAGRGDERVHENVGPRKEHGLLTGHLLDVLEDDGSATLTAFEVAHDVRRRVEDTLGAQQSPDYVRLEGDGDFVFRAPGLEHDVPREEPAPAPAPEPRAVRPAVVLVHCGGSIGGAMGPRPMEELRVRRIASRHDAQLERDAEGIRAQYRGYYGAGRDGGPELLWEVLPDEMQTFSENATPGYWSRLVEEVRAILDKHTLAVWEDAAEGARMDGILKREAAEWRAAGRPGPPPSRETWMEALRGRHLLGVVLLFGTDTMGYAASALALGLRNLPCSVVFTGAYAPPGPVTATAWPRRTPGAT